MKSAEIVTLARAWIGTPYLHQASVPGVGADCLGLIRGVWRQYLGAEPCAVPAYSGDWIETGGGEGLMAALVDLAPGKPVELVGPGDILLFRMRAGSVAKHLAVMAGTPEAPSFIHAYSGHSVVESPLSLPWRRRLAAAFEFPDRRI